VRERERERERENIYFKGKQIRYKKKKPLGRKNTEKL
jgi:hypothetical protein